MSNKFKVDLTASDKFWTPKGLGSVGMDPYRAISELVANSLDWRRLPEDNVTPVIQVILDKGMVEVRGNGVGMTPKELQDSIQLSQANDERRKSLRLRKGMFGMGMKVAALSLGWHIKIVTRSIQKESEDNVLTLNTRLFDHTDDLSVRDNIYGDSINKNLKGPLGNWESGTSIIISDLTNKFLQPIAVRDTLQEVFRPEIGVEGIQIQVVDLKEDKIYECEQVTVPVFEDYTIKLDDLDLFVKSDDGEEMKIRGWLGLMKSASSGLGMWGIHLFKDNQVIERFHQLPIRLGGLLPRNPHPVFGRTFGEIHLDMCKPNFHKVGFDYTTESWKEVQALLSDQIGKIMTASQEYRAGDGKKAHQALKKIQQHTKASKEAVAKIRNQKKEDKEVNTPDNALVLANGEWFIIVEPVVESFGANSLLKPWRYHFREESKELVIIINSASALYDNHINAKANFSDDVIEIIVNWSISDCLMLFLHERFGYSLTKALDFRDQQLNTLFSKSDSII